MAFKDMLDQMLAAGKDLAAQGTNLAEKHMKDDAERRAIHDAMTDLSLDDDTKRMMEAELARALDVQDIAAGADSTEAAAEIYLASLFVIDTASPAERSYLDRLATALGLHPELTRQLEAKAAAA
ncbi:MAG: DUF533 domain-containing protein [Gammaproteobacteria bacterium]|jgi:uncharacterized membrane protein YebE (DUF533 family)|nr:DUF533 domain-containing protein [Gammaproteobacteria bacterium]